MKTKLKIITLGLSFAVVLAGCSNEKPQVNEDTTPDIVAETESTDPQEPQKEYLPETILEISREDLSSGIAENQMGDYLIAVEDENELSIKSYTGTSEDIIIPAVVKIKGEEGYFGEIVRISNSALSHGTLKSVEIPFTIEDIGNAAFFGNQIETLIFHEGSNLNIVKAEAFSTNKIKGLELPDSLKTIKKEAFFNNEIETLQLGENVTSIEGSAFANNKIKQLNIPDSVVRISGHAFLNNDLETVRIGKGVGGKDNDVKTEEKKSLGCGVFNGNPRLAKIEIDPDNPNYHIVNNAVYTKDKQVLLIGTSEIAHDMGDIEVIGNGAFKGLGLESVTIPETVKTIASDAFANDSVAPENDNTLTKVAIPSDVMLVNSSISQSFRDAYITNELRAGIYTSETQDGEWTYSAE